MTKNQIVKSELSNSYLTSKLSFEDICTKGKFNFQKIMGFFQRERRLDKQIVSEIISRAIHILQMEPNLIHIEGPVWVIGDLHGQFYDFSALIQNKLNLQKYSLVFLGDYVDRGNFSVEVMLSLLTLKLNHPKKVILLRGNHECQQMTAYFNFHQQCLKKYDQQIYHAFMDLFKHLPLAATINRSFLCVHGGLSESLQNLEKIARIDRFHQIPNSGIFCDLVWADPSINPNGMVNGLQEYNKERGCSYIFGKQLIGKFLHQNGVTCIIRGHQAEQKGYRLFHWQGDRKFPSVITIFSAPNYCDFYNNKGACLYIQDEQMNIQQFGEVAHPFMLPDFMDVFEWSIPFVAQKLSQMMFFMLQPDKDIEIEEQNDIFKIKIQIMRKILNGHKRLANQNIEYTHFRGRSLDNMLAHDKQARQYIQMQHMGDDFEVKKSIDQKYEKRPILNQFFQWN